MYSLFNYHATYPIDSMLCKVDLLFYSHTRLTLTVTHPHRHSFTCLPYSSLLKIPPLLLPPFLASVTRLQLIPPYIAPFSSPPSSLSAKFSIWCPLSYSRLSAQFTICSCFIRLPWSVKFAISFPHTSPSKAKHNGTSNLAMFLLHVLSSHTIEVTRCHY